MFYTNDMSFIQMRLAIRFYGCLKKNVFLRHPVYF
jgi:hypothetical protein